MPRFQPMSSYLLYSSLVFHHSQAPISIAIKCLAQPRSLPALQSQLRHYSSPAGYVLFLQTVMGQPPSTLYAPWQLEVNYVRRIILHHQFPFSSHPHSSPIPVSTSLIPTIPIYLTLGHVIFPVWTIIHL